MESLPQPPDTWYVRHGKRWLDLLLALPLTLLTLPLLMLLALTGAVAFGGNPFFGQTRIGWRERPFRLVKLRSMRGGAGTDAERLTPYGRWLRRTSLDELPQLWHVVRGQMSLVGPRPLLPQYLPRYSAVQRQRHSVRPGITGLAQVNGRNAVDWPTRLAVDVQYVQTVSLAQDLRILTQTLRLAVSGRGVAAEGQATMQEFQGEQ